MNDITALGHILTRTLRMESGRIWSCSEVISLSPTLEFRDGYDDTALEDFDSSGRISCGARAVDMDECECYDEFMEDLELVLINYEEVVAWIYQTRFMEWKDSYAPPGSTSMYSSVGTVCLKWLEREVRLPEPLPCNLGSDRYYLY